MLRSIGAIALGLVVAFILVTIFEFASLAMMPPGIDPMSDPDSLARAIEAGQIPFISMLLVILGYVAGSFGGRLALRGTGAGTAVDAEVEASPEQGTSTPSV